MTRPSLVLAAAGALAAVLAVALLTQGVTAPVANQTWSCGSALLPKDLSDARPAHPAIVEPRVACEEQRSQRATRALLVGVMSACALAAGSLVNQRTRLGLPR